jgi:hypothetical protein
MLNEETVRLGNEYDNTLRDALGVVLTEMSSQRASSDWMLAGSQELDRTRVNIGGRALLIESETYIGLTITGETSLVQEIARRVAERIKAAGDPAPED